MTYCSPSFQLEPVSSDSLDGFFLFCTVLREKVAHENLSVSESIHHARVTEVTEIAFLRSDVP